MTDSLLKKVVLPYFNRRHIHFARSMDEHQIYQSSEQTIHPFL